MTMTELNDKSKNNKNFQWLERFSLEQAAAKNISTNITFDYECPLSVWESAKTLLGVDASTLTKMIAAHFEIDIAQKPHNISEQLLHYVPLKVAKEYTIFPLALENGLLIVASPIPFDTDMESMLGFFTSLHIKSQLAPPELILKWTDLYYESDVIAQSDIVIKSNQTTSNSQKQAISSDSAIVKIVSEMLLEAFLMKASDIHIEPFHDGGIVRYRIDGMLRILTELSGPIFVPIIQRVKAISNLNLAKKMIPQDGSVSLELKGKDVDLRISTLPVKGGEKAVIRLLVKSVVSQLDEIGLQEKELTVFKQLLQSSEGIFVITGPTGSGKTSTLYAALKELNSPEKCLVTVEDPVEYEIEGIAQVNINPNQNLTFPAALRSILRQDPDVVLMGEIRDEETAEVTFRAAITGHFVMTTLHTSDAITTIPRLIGLGVSRPVIADSLKGVAAQRLVRKLCVHCSKDGPIESDKFGQRFHTAFPKLTLKSPVGCEKCEHTGYKGRIPLFEIITMDSRLADAIRAGDDSSQLRKIADESGARSLYRVAIEAVSNGQTSAEEINRVLGASFWQQ